MTSDDLWERANQRWRERDAAGAIAALDELLTAQPAHPAALNFAGWLRTTALADTQFDRGLEQLKAALAVEEVDPRAPANLANALVSKGRAQEAVALLQPWCEAHSLAEAWNVLGWLQGVELNELKAAQASLRRAVGLRSFYGDAHLNLARVCLKAQKPDEAFEHLEAAVRSQNCWRPHEAWARIGELCALKGWLRRALEALRRSTELDQRGEYTLATDTNIAAMTQVLSLRGQYFPHAHDSSVHARRLERHEGPPQKPPEPLAELASLGRTLKAGRAESALEAARACLEAGALLPQYSGMSVALELEATGDAGLKEFSARWRKAFQALYAELLDREEAAHDLITPRGRAEQAGLARQWSQAVLELERCRAESTEASVTFTAAAAEEFGDMATRLGDRASAQRLYALAEDAAAEYASWSSSGAEGMGRMVDVNRLREKLKA